MFHEMLWKKNFSVTLPKSIFNENSGKICIGPIFEINHILLKCSSSYLKTKTYLSKGIIPLNNNRTFKWFRLPGITIRTFICQANERTTYTFHCVTPGVHKMTIKTLKFVVRLTILWILSVSGVLPRTLN